MCLYFIVLRNSDLKAEFPDAVWTDDVTNRRSTNSTYVEDTWVHVCYEATVNLVSHQTSSTFKTLSNPCIFYFPLPAIHTIFLHTPNFLFIPTSFTPTTGVQHQLFNISLACLRLKRHSEELKHKDWRDVSKNLTFH